MRTTYYSCDQCGGKFDNEDKLLRLGQYDNFFGLRNNLPNRRMMDVSNHIPIHFCSKKCLLAYFFHNDESGDQSAKIWEEALS